MSDTIAPDESTAPAAEPVVAIAERCHLVALSSSGNNLAATKARNRGDICRMTGVKKIRRFRLAEA